LASPAGVPAGVRLPQHRQGCRPEPVHLWLIVCRRLPVGRVAHRRGTSLAVLPYATAGYRGPLVLSPEPVVGILGSTVFTIAVCAVLRDGRSASATSALPIAYRQGVPARLPRLPAWRSAIR